MVHPLIHGDSRPLNGCQMGNAVFRENGYIIGSDQFRNAVVDLRINMVRASGKHDSTLVIVLHPLKNFFSFSLDVLSDSSELVVCLMGGVANLVLRDAIFFAKVFNQFVCQNLFTLKGKEGVLENNIFF